MCKSKVKGGKVTDKNIHYEGSITLDKRIMKQADILPGEMVHVLNVNSGARVETYAIEGPAGSGTICINGAAARLFEVGDPVIILAAAIADKKEADQVRLNVVELDQNNRLENR